MSRDVTFLIAGVAALLAAGVAGAQVLKPSDPVRYEHELARQKRAGIKPSHFAREGAQPPVPVSLELLTAWGREVRTIDGLGNNVSNPQWGAVGDTFLRMVPASYADGISVPSGSDRPSPREISNILCEQSGLTSSKGGATDFLWQWGQFIDHDITLSPAPSYEPMPIPVPEGDPYFDPNWTGTQEMPFDRTAYDHTTGLGPGNPRQQYNFITAYIDASNVYSSSPARAFWLRMYDPMGRLDTSPGDYLPYNNLGLSNAGGTSRELFLAGDVRANEQCGLTVMHTLFVREHNRLVAEMTLAEPGLTGEEYFQRARAIVGAQLQVITYKEFLPALLGEGAIAPYAGYDPTVHPGISNIFTSGAYRLGHSMISTHLLRFGSGEDPQTGLVVFPAGHLPLREIFFAPWRMTEEGGMDPILRGLAAQTMQEVDPFIVDDTRNFLFGPPGTGGMDLAALNIQRGRDHGLPSYTQARVALGLAAVTSFADITSNSIVAAKLLFAYGDVGKIDFWSGALSEDHQPGAQVGPSLYVVIKDQFEKLRDGDRFWYQNFFSGPLLMELEETRLIDIIRRNTNIGTELQDNVFKFTPETGIPAASSWGVAIFALGLLCAGSVFAIRRNEKPEV